MGRLHLWLPHLCFDGSMVTTFVSRVIDSLNCGVEGRFRTLRGVDLRCDANGCVESYIGSSVVVVPLVAGDDEQAMALRFYVRAKSYLREIYGGMYYPEEFIVDHGGDVCRVDVVMTPWVEGRTLSDVVHDAAHHRDGERIITEISHRFDRLAMDIVESHWAHGDICCENIVVTPEGDLLLIDNDSNFIPELEGCCSDEIGHSAHQSPERGVEHFHHRIDDFSIALLSVTLAALSLDLGLYRGGRSLDSLLLDGENLGGDVMVAGVVDLLKRGGRVAHLAMVNELRRSPIVIDRLPQLLRFICRDASINGEVEIFEDGGYWGYRSCESGVVVIPAMFDLACNFDCDGAVASVDRSWYRLDRSGALSLYSL